jgi:hypothetical protein
MDSKVVQQIIESSRQEMASRQNYLTNKWSRMIEKVGVVLEARGGRKLTQFDKSNIALVLENSVAEAVMRSGSKLLETTDNSAISFLGVQLPLISVLMPSLVLNDIAIVQALDRRTGSVFYLNVNYGSTRGAITAGDQMVGAKTGHNRTQAGRLYASTRVTEEILAVSGARSVTTTLKLYPVIEGSISIAGTLADGTAIAAVVDAANVITGTGISSGTIDYSTGEITVTFSSALDSDGATISYKYNYQTATNGVAEVNFEVVAASVTAEDFPLKAIYTMAAQLDLMKAHGANLEDLVINVLSGEIRNWSRVARKAA